MYHRLNSTDRVEAIIGAKPIQPPARSTAVPDVVEALARGLSAILGKRLTGVYLGGSFSMGDFAAETSDYDFLVVVEDNLSLADLRGISDLHQRLLRDQPEAWRLEGDYAPRHLLVPEGTRRPVPGYFDGHFEANPPEIMLSADNIANLRLDGIVVLGPPASDVLPLVEPDQVRAAAREMLLASVDKCGTEAEAGSELLNRLRSRSAWETGQPTTKSQGAEWAVRHLDRQWHAVIRRAEAVRRGAATEDSDRTLREALPELIRLAQAIHAG